MLLIREIFHKRFNVKTVVFFGLLGCDDIKSFVTLKLQ